MRLSSCAWVALGLVAQTRALDLVDCAQTSTNVTWQLEHFEYVPGSSDNGPVDDYLHIVMHWWSQDVNLTRDDCDYFAAPTNDSWYKCRNSGVASGGPVAPADLPVWYIGINTTTWNITMQKDWSCTTQGVRYNLTAEASAVVPVETFHYQGSQGEDHFYGEYDGDQVILHPTIKETKAD